MHVDHRHCPSCGVAIRPTATACPPCFVAQVRAALDRNPPLDRNASGENVTGQPVSEGGEVEDARYAPSASPAPRSTPPQGR